jgi:pimeloyl-ACP methyl ester carboxylesterase
MRDLIFTVAIGSASRTLMLRDRLLGLPKKAAEAEEGSLLIRHRIPSGDNLLDAVFMQPVGRPTRAAALICHGIGETVEHWRAAQRLLAENCVASLVFNYSGYGRSTGRIDAKQCERDAIAAFRFLEQLAPSQPLSLLGFSLGSGIATAIVARVAAHRLVLCAAFTSLRKAARSIGVPGALARLLPAIWNTEDTLGVCMTPVVIVHGEKDRLFPAKMAQDLARACGGPCELVLVPELSHNTPIYHPDFSYWSLVIARIANRP